MKGSASGRRITATHDNIKILRRVFLKTGISTEALSDMNEAPSGLTSDMEAKRFFAQQRRRALASIPQSRKASRHTIM